ncbi:MAG: dUTP diphosphatase [Alphaproteobacteria bacterium]|nr:dUTP diphosphatase [Alphaproteobacteria bacterium]
MTQKLPTLLIARTADGAGLPLPSYLSEYHVGLTLCAAIPSSIRIEPGERVYVPIGFAIGIPKGWCGQIVSNPTLAREQGVIVLDGPQILHPADRGAVFVLLQNSSPKQIVLRRGVEVAQLIVVPVTQIRWQDVSGQVSIASEKTDPAAVLLDSELDVSSEGNEVMTSSKRVQKTPRNRFGPSEDEE